MPIFSLPELYLYDVNRSKNIIQNCYEKNQKNQSSNVTEPFNFKQLLLHLLALLF